MVNDEKLDTWRRGLAIYFLFDRHVKKDATLGELAEMLKGSKWINKDTVGISGAYMGPDLPFDFTYGDTMIAIGFFPKKDIDRQNKDCVVIWVNVTGKILPQDFVFHPDGPRKE